MNQNQNEKLIRQAVHDTVIRAVTEISADVKGLLEDALLRETNETARSMLGSMIENLAVAKSMDKAVCQSPGYPTTWLSYGEDNFPQYISSVIADALAEATGKGYLRPSIVDPLTRENPGNNTGKGRAQYRVSVSPRSEVCGLYHQLQGLRRRIGQRDENYDHCHSGTG